jgi:hypothetical protein
VSWKQNLLDRAAEALRFTLKACVFLDIFMVCVFSVWLSAKFLWFSFRLLDRTLFSSPW